MIHYDIFADIHGHAETLSAMLVAFGYEERNGAFRHPDRKAAFVGDFVDRGPRQIETLDLVRRMLDADTAVAVMGNHEYNAIGWHTPRQDGPGFLRSHSETHARQHVAFLNAVGDDKDLHDDLIGFMRSLPLWIDLGPFRLVHACWHQPSMDALAPHVDAYARMTDDGLHAMYTKGTPADDARSVVLTGMEFQLPDGATYFDKDGHARDWTRTKWWDPDATTMAQAAIGLEGLNDVLPDDPLPPSCRVDYPETEKPVFFGHYWMSGEPDIISANKACLDYSVAKDGVLCAYRMDGDMTLTRDNLFWMAPGGELRHHRTETFAFQAR